MLQSSAHLFKFSSKSQGLAKNERLHNIKEIEQLYSQGTSFLKHPLRVVFSYKPISELGIKNEKVFPAQALFTVSKRNYKRAHDRNRLKRLMREAYRLHKELLLQAIVTAETPFVYYFSFQYIGKEILPFKQIEKKLISALEHLATFPKQEVKKGKMQWGYLISRFYYNKDINRWFFG